VIKKYNQIFAIIILSLMISNCNTVKKAFDPERKNSSEEFLVEKKSPLSMPPEFDELPVPQTKMQENQNQNQSVDIKELITEKSLNQKELDEVDNLDKSFEKNLLDKINKIDVNS
jgi:hypothetical protein